MKSQKIADLAAVKARGLRAYRSRAAFKLLEIDDTHKLLRNGMRVVDFGSSPGGWSQVIAERIKSKAGSERCIAIDQLKMDPI